MADDIAHGIVRIDADVDQAIRNIRAVDGEYRRAMQSIDRQRATLKVDVQSAELKRELAFTEKISDARKAQIKTDLARLAVRKQEAANAEKAHRIEQNHLKAIVANNDRVERSHRNQIKMQSEALRMDSMREAQVKRLQNAYVKQEEALKRAEQVGRSPLRGRLKSVQQEVSLQTGTAKAEMVALRAQLAALGAKPVEIDIRLKGENRLANMLKGLSEMTVRVGPFTATIRQFLVVLALLGPMLVGVTGALTSLVGVLSSGLIGALAASTAALGGFALALGGVAITAAGYVKEIGHINKAQEAYDKAVREHGKNSDEAAKKQKILNNVTGAMGKDTVKAVAGLDELGGTWRKLTRESRPVFFETVAGFVNMMNSMMPMLARNTNTAFAAIGAGMQRWMQGLSSANGQAGINAIFEGFNAALPPLMRGLGHIGAALRNIGAAAAPYLRPIAVAFNSWAAGISAATANTPQLEASMQRLMGHAASVGRFFMALGRLIRTVLNGGADEGQGMLDTMTQVMNKWTEFLQSTRGRNEMAQFFQTARDLAGKFWTVLSSVVSVFFSIAQALAPVTSVTWGLFAALAKTVAKFMQMEGVQSIITGFGAALSIAFGVRIIGGMVQMIKAIGGIGGALKIVFQLIKMNPWVAAFGAIIAIVMHLWKTNDKFRNFIIKAWDAINSAVGRLGTAIGRVFTEHIPSYLERAKQSIRNTINDIIDVINKIPGVEIDYVINSGNASTEERKHRTRESSTGLYRGGIVNRPQVLVGEEAPRHPEYVIPTNPAYRDRATALWMSTGRDLGIPGFAKGGITNAAGAAWDAVKGVGSDIWAAGPGALLKKLPKNPGGPIVGPAIKYSLDKAKDWIKEKIGGLFGGGPLGKGVAGSLAGAMALARQMGLQITSTTGGKHAPNSWHYKGRAFDAAGSPGAMSQFFGAAAAKYGRNILELFYDPRGAIKNGSRTGAIGGHSDHIHLALAGGGVMGQPGVASRAIAQAKKMGASNVVIKALIEAGIVESGLQHDKYLSVGSGDRDSVGFLQQRPSQGWGHSKSLAGGGVEADTRQFVERAMALVKAGFKGGAGKLAQAVQRSAFPDRYAQQGGRAESIIKELAGGTRASRSGGSARTEPREVATRGSTTDLANRMASSQAKLDLAGRTRDPQDDVRAIMGYDVTRKLTTRERRSLRRQLRRLPFHTSSGPAAASIRAQLKAGTKTVHRSGRLDLLNEEARVRRLRLSKIDKALGGKLRPSTRQRLLEERAQLVAAQSQGRTDRDALRDQARNAPAEAARVAAEEAEAARVAAFKEKTDPLDTARAEASLTNSLGDDLNSVNNLYNHWNEALTAARQRGDHAGIQEAIGNVTQFGRDADELRQRIITEPMETRAALATLTKSLDDDLASATESLNYWQGALTAAQAAGDHAAIRTAVGNVSQSESEREALMERIATDPIEAGRALARLTEGTEDDVEWTKKLMSYYEPLLEAAKLTNDYTTIQRLAPIVGGLRDEVNSAPTMAQQIGAFNAARLDLYRNMGSNFNPVAQQSSARNTTIINNFDAPPPDAHTWVQQQKFELQAAL